MIELRITREVWKPKQGLHRRVWHYGTCVPEPTFVRGIRFAVGRWCIDLRERAPGL